MSAMVRVRTAYPFHQRKQQGTIHWACLLECGHTIELDLARGERPRRLSCPLCVLDSGASSAPDEFCIDFGQ